MENKIMANEDVLVEATEEIATTSSRKGLKVGLKVGLAVLVGVGIYKAVKRIKAKAKAKKEHTDDTIGDVEEPVKFVFDEDGNPIEE